MKLHVKHIFLGITLTQYGELYFEESFNEYLCKGVNLTRNVKEKTLNGTSLNRVTTVSPDRVIPGPVAKVIKMNRLEYDEELTYDTAAFKGTWKIQVPGPLGAKFSAGGEFVFREVDGGVERELWGELNVKVFGVGKMIETLIVTDVEKSYETAAAQTSQYIRDNSELFA
jgi:hypothetical protein